MTEGEIRALLKQWIVKRSKKGIALHEIDDSTPIIESGLLSSLDVAEFVLYIESLRGGEIDVDDIEPDVFNSIESMWRTFFAASAA
jgi:acyl carrier protein